MKRKGEQVLEENSPAVLEGRSKAQNGVGDTYGETQKQMF